MNSDILFYAIAFIGQLVVISLALAIFSSVFIRNKRKGYIALSVIILLNLYTLIIGFEFSQVMGIGFVIIDVSLGIVTYIVVQRKRRNQRKSVRNRRQEGSSRRSM